MIKVSKFKLKHYIPFILIIAKKKRFSMSVSLVIIFFKLPPTLRENGVKDPLVIGQYGAGFGSSPMGTGILNMKMVEYFNLQLKINA